MKRILFSFFALAAVLSCNKTESEPVHQAQSEPGLISFGVSELTATRAVVESTAATLSESGFNVAAVTGTATYFNELATKSGYSYYTANKYYYPQSSSVDFYACHPVERALDVTAGEVSIDYTQDSSEDLIVAVKKGVQSQTGDVQLVFDHVLSQLCFTAKGSDSNVDYVLKSIDVKAPNGGTYTFSDGEWTRGNLASVGFFDGELPVSSSEATPVDEVMTFLPGDIQLTVSWECLSDGQLVGEYTKSTLACGDPDAIKIDMGKRNTINLVLPNADASGISFTVQVNPWGDTSQDVVLD